MCGKKSKTGARSIVLFFLLLLLVASPCCAAASWAAWFHGEEESATESPKASSQMIPLEDQTVVTAFTEYSPTESQIPSQESKTGSLQTLEPKLKELETQLTEANSSLQKLDSQLKAMEETNEISEAEAESVKESLVSTLTANTSLADRNAELEKEAGSKAYLLVGGFVGFENSLPEYGVTLDLGIRIGDSLLSQTGIDYEIGNMKNPIIMPTLDLDRMRFRAAIGWMW